MILELLVLMLYDPNERKSKIKIFWHSQVFLKQHICTGKNVLIEKIQMRTLRKESLKLEKKTGTHCKQETCSTNCSEVRYFYLDLFMDMCNRETIDKYIKYFNIVRDL